MLTSHVKVVLVRSGTAKSGSIVSKSWLIFLLETPYTCPSHHTGVENQVQETYEPALKLKPGRLFPYTEPFLKIPSPLSLAMEKKKMARNKTTQGRSRMRPHLPDLAERTSRSRRAWPRFRFRLPHYPVRSSAASPPARPPSRTAALRARRGRSPGPRNLTFDFRPSARRRSGDG
jgi:hypothetical protein